MAPQTCNGIDGPGKGNSFSDITTSLARLLLLILIPFLLTACGDENGIHSVGGYAVDGPLNDAMVEVSGLQGVLAEGRSGADGRFAVNVSVEPPYRLRVSGGTLDGVPYDGVLEALCETTACHVTPWTTAVVRLMDRYGFNAGDARAMLAGMADVDGDPFMQVLADGQSVPVKGVKPNVARDIPDDAADMGDWVDGIVRGDGDCQFPGCGGLPPDVPADDLPPPEEPAGSAPPEELPNPPGICSQMQPADPRWFEPAAFDQTMRRSFGDRPVVDSDRIELTLPLASNSPVVPLNIRSTLDRVQAFHAFLEQDGETSLAFVHGLCSSRAVPVVAIRLRVERSARLHVVAQTAGGLYRTSAMIHVAGSGQPTTPSPRSAAGGLITVRATAREGIAAVKALVSTFEPAGPEEPRLQIAAWEHNGIRVGKIDMNPDVFPLPAYFAFEFSGARPGDKLSVSVLGKGGWADSAKVTL